jgi:hypothetical protein
MSDFKCVLIEDSRIADITSEEVFGVQSGASQSTYQQFQAVSSSNSSVVFSVQIPSENIVIDRHLLLQSNVLFTINATGVPAGDLAFQYGLTDCLQAFPLNSLFTTTQATINNVSVSTNTQDVLPMLMRMNDNRVLSRYNSLTPSLPDNQYGMYSDAVGANSNPLATISNNSYDTDFVPRGAYPITFVSVLHNITAGGTDTSLISTNVADTWTIVLSAQFTEPFLALSPFINCLPNNSAGLVGINNMSLVLNVDATCKRFFSTANTTITGSGSSAVIGSYITNITLGSTAQPVGFSNTRLLFNFLSLQPEQYAKISTKNVVPFLDYPRYLTTFTNSSALAPAGTTTLTSQSIQLNQIPDLIIICARVPMSAQKWYNTSSFLKINGIQVNFNNSSGLLATATAQDLYNISVANGSSQTYSEFVGAVNNNDPSTGQVISIPTTGSLLVLNPVNQFSLPSYLSASSLGQYQFQFNLSVENQFPYAITPEVVILTMNSGIFCTQQGTSQIFTGILTKEQVLKTKEMNPVPHLDSGEYSRLVGGKLQNMGMSSLMKMVRHYKKNKLAGGIHSGAGFPSGNQSGSGLYTSSKSKVSKHLI